MHANAEESAPEKPANSASLTVNPTSERQSASLMSMSQRAMASWRKEANEKMYSPEETAGYGRWASEAAPNGKNIKCEADRQKKES